MSQERVYQALAEKPGQFLSGQELSGRLGISRAAVWKAVESLRRQGYEIEARSGRGYRLLEHGDRLDRRAVAGCLTAPRDYCQVLSEVDSTNSACKRLAAEGRQMDAFYPDLRLTPGQQVIIDDGGTVIRKSTVKKMTRNVTTYMSKEWQERLLK